MHYAEDPVDTSIAIDDDKNKEISDDKYHLVLSKLNNIYRKTKDKASLFLEWIDN